MIRIAYGYVSLVHQSVKDFLLEQATVEYDRFLAMRTVSSQSSAVQLATTCVQHLLLGDFEVDFFLTNDSSTSPSLEISDFLDKLPLSDYSGDFGMAKMTTSLLMCFFANQMRSIQIFVIYSFQTTPSTTIHRFIGQSISRFVSKLLQTISEVRLCRFSILIMQAAATGYIFIARVPLLR